jgi:hypothetical protein
MAVTAKIPGKLLLAILNKEVDWNSDTFKCLLLKSAYTFDQDAHDYLDDVTAHEVTGTNYARQTLSGLTVAYAGATNTASFDAADVTFAQITLDATNAARYAWVYDDMPATDATKPLVCLIDFGANQQPTTEDLIISFHADGVIKGVAAA